MANAKRRRVLVVEDDEELISSHRRFFDGLDPQEFSAAYAPDAERALEALREEAFDVAILDWGLPGISGASLAKALRASAKTRALGILMVTARSEPAETIFALESGADDFLSKPFDWSVLLARLRSLARRSELTLDRHLTRSFPGLELDLDAQRLKVDGREVRATPKELGLLTTLLSRPGVVHAREALWRTVWGYESVSWDRILTVTISSLRVKLGP